MHHGLHIMQSFVPIRVRAYLPHRTLVGHAPYVAHSGNYVISGSTQRFAQGPTDETGGAGDEWFHLCRNPSNLAGYLERIFSMLVGMPFSRQARSTSRLSRRVLRHPPVLMPPVRMRTNTSGR